MLSPQSWSLSVPWLLALSSPITEFKIDRESIVQQFNLELHQSHPYGPVQVGNENFAFGTDITGLQTFVPHNTLSSWGWHNASLPTTPNQTLPRDFSCVYWWTHDRLVNYEQPNPAEKSVSQWMISKPHRINLGRVGLWFGGSSVSEEILEKKSQMLDLWEGTISSFWSLDGVDVRVQTIASPDTDTIAVEMKSELLKMGKLGVWNATVNHTTVLKSAANRAIIRNTLDATSYLAVVSWGYQAGIERSSNRTHNYILKSRRSNTLAFTVTYSLGVAVKVETFKEIKEKAAAWRDGYWPSGAFVSIPIGASPSAKELQRRIILSQYLLAVNDAGKDPVQESGLVNNGWYGKFHMEMVFWHLAHWTLWDKWPLYDRSIGGYEGARIGKMSDPSGRSAPGKIKSFLIWQRPHPMYFAEIDYIKFPTAKTLEKWDHILTAVADSMVGYAWFNQTTKVYDLGPPMYSISGNTNPNQNINPTFELAYWRFGLDVAEKWQSRQGKPIPSNWQLVKGNLAPFPVEGEVYMLYEGVKEIWTTPTLAEYHPGLLKIYGRFPTPEKH